MMCCFSVSLCELAAKFLGRSDTHVGLRCSPAAISNVTAWQHGLYHYPLYSMQYVYLVLLLCCGRGVAYCDRFVCLCVCLSVHKHISGTALPFVTKFFVQLPVSVAQSSSDGIAICYLLPVLWMMRRLAVMGRSVLPALQYQDRVWCLWMPCYGLTFPLSVSFPYKSVFGPVSVFTCQHMHQNYT